MTCPVCRTPNPATARFCMHCGAALVNGRVCSRCFTLLPVAARYCFHCGEFQGEAPGAFEAAPARPMEVPGVTIAPVAPQQPVPPVVAPAPVTAPVVAASPPAPEPLPAAPGSGLPAALPLETLRSDLRRYLPPALYEPLERRPKERDLLAVRDHLSALLETVKTYLPRPVVLDPQPAGEPAGGMYRGVFLFGDVSGFTPLSERLKPLGNEGAERITDIINRLFSQLVAVLFAHGGTLLKFGGDALLGLFPAESDAELAAGVLRAAQAALEMQAVMEQDEFAAIDALGETRALKIKCGISAGPYFAAHIGLPPRPEANDNGAMAYVTTGRTVNLAEEAEGHAHPGEVAMPRVTYALVEGQLEVGPVAKSPDEAYVRLLSVKAALEKPEDAALPSEPPEGETLAQITYLTERLNRLTPYLSDELVNRIAFNPRDARITPDHRPVTVMFVNYVGISDLIEDMGASHPRLIVEQLNSYFVHMAQVVERYEGLLARMDQYAVGDRLVIFFGAPRAHEDDPVRAVYTALEMQQLTRERFSALQTPFGIYRFRQRIGINTGSLFAGNAGAPDLRQEYTLMGDDINMAARLMSYAEWGKIYISNKTEERVRPFFELSDRFDLKVKGKEILIPTYEVLGKRGEVGRTRGLEGGDSPLVGREEALERLQQSGRRFLAGRGQIVALLGNSGLGKSRLLRELRAWFAEQPGAEALRWIEARPFSFSEQINYWLAREMLRNVLDLPMDASDNDMLFRLWEQGESLLGKEKAREATPFLAHLMNLPLEGAWAEELKSLTPQVRQKEILWAAREFFIAAAKRSPLLIALDDLHWADEASLTLIEALLGVTDQAPLLFLLAFRPARDKRSWQLRNTAAGDYPHRYTEVQLQPLTRPQSQSLLQVLLPGAEFAEATCFEIFDKAAGNPFYLEEVVRSLIESGSVVEDALAQGTATWATTAAVTQADARRRWRVTAKIEQISVPTSLQAAIVSRIDRLTEDARQGLQMAAVIGRQFRVDLLRGISQVKEEVDLWLAQLERGGLLRETETAHTPTYAFPDALVQEVAYDSILVQNRHRLHRRVGEALEEISEENPGQLNQLLAYHFSRSDDHEKALKYLQLAAAEARNDYANETAIAYYQQLLELRQKLRDPAGQAQARYAMGVMAYEIGDYDRAMPWLEEASALYQQVGDEANAGWSIMYQGMVSLKRGHYAEATASHQQALDLARKRQDGFQEGIHLTNLARVTLRLGDYALALAQFQDSLALKQRHNDLTGQAFAHFYIGLTQLFRGDYEAADHAFGDSLGFWQRVSKNDRGVSYCYYGLGLLALYRGRFEDAAGYLRQAHEISVKLVLKAEIVETLSFLARAQAGLGQREAALAASEQAAALLKTQRDVEAVQNIYLNHVYVLRAFDQPGAEAALEQAHAIVVAQAEHLEDAAARARFLEAVPANREILALWQQLQAETDARQ